MTTTTARKIMREVGCDWNDGYHVAITTDGNNTNDYYSEEEALKALSEIEVEEEFSIEVGRFFYFDLHTEEWMPETEIDWDTYTDEERDEVLSDNYWGTEYEWMMPEKLHFRVEERVMCEDR